MELQRQWGAEGEPGEAAAGPGEVQPQKQCRIRLLGMSSDGLGPSPYFQGMVYTLGSHMFGVMALTVLFLISSGQQGLTFNPMHLFPSGPDPPEMTADN